MNTGDGGKAGIWAGISADGTTAATIFEETMNGTLYCDVLQQELTQSMGKLPNKSAYTFQQDLAPCHTYVKTRPRKNGKIEVERIGIASEKSGSQSN